MFALREYTDSIVIKVAHSSDRLLDDVTLFLHSVQARLPDAQRRMLSDSAEHWQHSQVLWCWW